MKSLHQQLALYTAQLTAQQHETRAAKETLAEAEREMESVHFEKKQLLAQWRGSLNAIQRCCARPVHTTILSATNSRPVTLKWQPLHKPLI